MGLKSIDIVDVDDRDRRGVVLPFRKLAEFFLLRLAVQAAYLTLCLVLHGNEIFIWSFSFGGPILFLIQILLTNVYLTLKPFLRSIVWPNVSYRQAFLTARKVSLVARMV